jgi:flavin-dependent dehydrogenase
MKIAVIGIGVAGAYLMNRLSQAHDDSVIGFERMSKAQHDAVCAWATCENVMSGLAKNCCLNLDDYVMHRGKTMRVSLDNIHTTDSSENYIDIKLNGMVIYNKIKLIQDMIKGTKIEFGKVPKKENLETDFDIIIDSTGFHRNYLPKPKEEFWIPCIQYKVKYDIGKEPFSDFYLKAFPSMAGYFWYFPLGNGYAHIGAGDFERKQNNKFVDDFLSRYKCQIIKKVGRPVRISPPKNCEPFTDGKKVIGVGESIGTVYPLLGEGIIPATWCADILIQHMYDREKYRKEVLKKFEVYSTVFNFIRSKIKHKFNFLKNSYELLTIYNHMKREEDRYGMKVKIADMIKVSKI